MSRGLVDVGLWGVGRSWCDSISRQLVDEHRTLGCGLPWVLERHKSVGGPCAGDEGGRRPGCRHPRSLRWRRWPSLGKWLEARRGVPMRRTARGRLAGGETLRYHHTRGVLAQGRKRCDARRCCFRLVQRRVCDLWGCVDSQRWSVMEIGGGGGGERGRGLTGDGDWWGRHLHRDGRPKGRWARRIAGEVRRRHRVSAHRRRTTRKQGRRR